MSFTGGSNRPRMWPVAGFEQFMLADDSRRYPMVFWVKATFAGRVDEDRLRRAFEHTVLTQPLLRSRLCHRLLGLRCGLKWREDFITKAHFDVSPKGTPLNLPPGKNLAIDLKKEPGVRLFVREDEVSSEWYLQLHHSVSDGTGGFRFVEQLLTSYERSLTENLDVEDALFAKPGLSQMFPKRGKFGLSLWQIIRRLPTDLKSTLDYYAFRPRPLAKIKPISEKKLGEQQNALPASVNYTFNTASIAALKKTALAWSATLNDLLIRDLFLTLDRFNKSGYTSRKLRICMPVNLRPMLSESLPVANIMGMCGIDRSGLELDDPYQLMTTIAAETRKIKSERLALAINFIPALLSHLPFVLTAAMKRPGYWKCVATAVLSNLGYTFKTDKFRRNQSGQTVVDNLTLLRLELLPPVKIATNIAIGVVTYNGEMTLSLHYDRTVLSTSDANTILADYVTELSRSIMLTADSDIEVQGSNLGFEFGGRATASHLVKTQLPSLTN